MDRARRAELYDRVEQASEWPMLLLALIWVAIFVIPDVVDLSPDVSDMLDGVGWILWGIFVFETVAKTYLAPDRMAYLRSHWFELITILVPYLRPLRVAVAALLLWEEARITIRHRTFSFIGLASVLVVGLAAIAIYGAERGADGATIQSPADALWWAMATITTVGYGDVYPKTPIGRAIAVFLMLAGISLFSLLTARVAAFFVQSDDDKAMEARQEEMLERLRLLELQNAQIQAMLAARLPVSSGTEPVAAPAEAPDELDARLEEYFRGAAGPTAR